MRGTYFPDLAALVFPILGRPAATVAAIVPAGFERPKAGGPLVYIAPERPAEPADRAAIVRAVALRVLQSELEWSESDIRDTFPALNGIDRAEIDAVIAEDLS